MKKIVTQLVFLTVTLALWSCENYHPRHLELWYAQPARLWEETLPLGNGRLGMMPDGGIHREHIVLNDITMWSGSHDDTRNPHALGRLRQIQQLLLEGRNDLAQEMMYSYFACGGKGSNRGDGADAPYGSFQLMGGLDIDYSYPLYRDLLDSSDDLKAYRRSLELANATAHCSFTLGNTTYTRRYYASQTDDVLVIELGADRKASISFSATLSRPERHYTRTADSTLIMEGQLNNGTDGKGNRYKTLLKVCNLGGEVTYADGRVTVKEADKAYLLLSAGTELWSDNFEERITKLLERATATDGETLYRRHTEKWNEKFGRVVLDLGEQDNTLPTDRRLTAFQHNDDPSFAALYFQYGRYLMLSGTREDTMPLNLQGLWANTVRTPWNGDYHLNINLQMNYWPMEVTHLEELHQPLQHLIEGMVVSGEETARTFYGAKGWVAHMMTNPWGFTAPGEHASWGATNTGGAWLCQHLWEHYAFRPDTVYLKEVYPVMKGAAEFFLSSMIREKKNGHLVTAPSSSPENAFYMPGTKTAVNVCMGPTMDIQLVRELFTNTIAAAEILDTDSDFTARLAAAIDELPPMQISSRGGYLQEWLEDYEEVDLHHRHVSHLYGLYPSNLISVSETPELAEAARKTLERRGDDGTGWSRAWKINFWARLKDGDRAYKLLGNLLHPVAEEGKIVSNDGGTYPNLFCAHPPFQIDGNFGGCAGIAEMLIQSQNGYAEILPALPSSWSKGQFKGLRIRGGAVVDAQWSDGRWYKATLTAQTDNTFRVKLPDTDLKVEVNGKPHTPHDGMVTLSLQSGEQAVITLR